MCENLFDGIALIAEDDPLTPLVPMSLVTAVMPEVPAGHCTYTQVKVDDELTPRIRAAVAKLSLAAEECGKARVNVQEFVSDVLNAETARILGIKPIKRRPTAPPPHGKGRPRK